MIKIQVRNNLEPGWTLKYVCRSGSFSSFEQKPCKARREWSQEWGLSTESELRLMEGS